MAYAGMIFAILAGLLHVFIFYLESIAWESEIARKTFGTASLEEARATKFFAFNQGVYNLFLALMALIGAILWFAGTHTVGLTLALAGVSSMLVAALVLFAFSAAHRVAALKQGTLPALAVLFLLISLF